MSKESERKTGGQSPKRHVLSSDSSERIFGKHSGFQNIREGSELSATTKKLELNLTNVARGSLGELHKDYKKHLQRKRLPISMDDLRAGRAVSCR